MLFEEVCALKFTTVETYLSYESSFRYYYMITDFPVPVSPLIRVLNPPLIRILSISLNLTVSSVGTRMLKKGVLLSYIKGVNFLLQRSNSFVSKST